MGRTRPVPFALAVSRRRPGAGKLDRLRALRDRIADALQMLDAACWRGELSRKGLARMQQLRLDFTRLQEEIARRERSCP